MFKVVVATRQPSEDKEFWHSERTVRLISGGVVSRVKEEEELDEEDWLELDDDEPASSAGRLEEELSATPVPSAETRLNCAINFGWSASISESRLDIGIFSSAGNFFLRSAKQKLVFAYLGETLQLVLFCFQSTCHVDCH